MILPKPKRVGLSAFILEVVSPAERDENNRPINGTAKTKRYKVKKALKQHYKWHKNVEVLCEERMTLQTIKNINTQKNTVFCWNKER